MFFPTVLSVKLFAEAEARFISYGTVPVCLKSGLMLGIECGLIVLNRQLLSLFGKQGYLTPSVESAHHSTSP